MVSPSRLFDSYAYIASGNSVTFNVTGLTTPAYNVYAVSGPQSRPGEFILNGTTVAMPSTTNQTTFVLNTNYAEFASVSPTAGAITLTASAGAGSEFNISGFQLVPIVNSSTANLLPATTALSVASGAILDLAGASQQVASLSDLVAGQGGTVQNSGVSASILTLAGSAGVSTTYSGLIGGTGSLGNIGLIVAGGGLQNLAGSNNYTGGTQVTGGTLQLGNANAIGTGALAANGGVFDLAEFSVTVPSFSGASGTVTTSVAQPVTLAVSQTGSTAFGGALQNGAGVLSLAFSGGNGGRLNLYGVNTYSGSTHILAGTLQLGSSTALNGASAVTIDNGSLLDLNAFRAGIGALNGSGYVNNVAGYGTSVLTLGNGNASGSFSGTIQNSTPNGGLALVKTGSGTQYLSLANTYNGGTTLSAGTLNFTALALGTGSITFNGGTLQYAAGNTQDVSPAIASLSGYSALIDTNSNTVAFGSGLSGNGGLTKLGAGMLTLNGTSTYTGTTLVSAGTLQLGSSNPGACPSGP